MSSETPYFSCPVCRVRRFWKPQLAGKRAKCTCGHLLIVPARPLGTPAVPTNFEEAFEAAAHDQDAVDKTPPSYDVAPAEALPAPLVPRPILIERQKADGSASTVSSVTRPTVHMNPAVLYRKGLQREKSPAPPVFSPLRDLGLPALLIAVGIALGLLDATYKGSEGWVALHSVIGSVTLNMAASLAIAIAAVFAASAMGGVAFQEPVPVIIYKLCAVSLAPGAIGSLAGHWIGGINGDIAGVPIGLACYFLLFVLLFRMAMADRIICVMLLFIIRTTVAYLIFKFQGAKAGSEI